MVIMDGIFSQTENIDKDALFCKYDKSYGGMAYRIFHQTISYNNGHLQLLVYGQVEANKMKNTDEMEEATSWVIGVN